MAVPKLQYKDLFFSNWRDISKSWGGPALLIFQKEKVSVFEAIMTFIALNLFVMPIFYSIIAGVKSLFDLFTRKPLANEHLTLAATRLETMSNKNVKHCVQDVIANYSCPKSSSSSLLRQELSNSMNSVQLRSQITAQVKKQRKDENRADQPGEVQEVNAAIAAQKLANHSFRRAALLTFFQNPDNVGKKMQHVIVDAINRNNIQPPPSSFPETKQLFWVRLAPGEKDNPTEEDLRLAKILDSQHC